MPHQNEFGVVGLGKMGGGLAQLALEKGFRVVGSSQGSASAQLRQAGLVQINDPAEFESSSNRQE